MKIDVIAKVNGVHAATGLGLVAGETYTIDEDKFGDEVFQKVEPEEGRARKKPARPETEEKEG